MANDVSLNRKINNQYRINLLFPKKWTTEWMKHLSTKCEEALVDEVLSRALFPVLDGASFDAESKYKPLYRRCYVIPISMTHLPTVVDCTGERQPATVVCPFDTVSVSIEIVNNNDTLSFDCQTIQWLGTPKKGEYVVATKTLLELASRYPALDISLNYPVKGCRVIPATPLNKGAKTWKYRKQLLRKWY
jgi:hypothetical protein